MAVQKRLIKGALACAFALMLSGCVTIPDAIKGSSPTPQQDLVRVMNAPQLYIGKRRVLAAKLWRCKISREKPGLKSRPYRLIAARVLFWAKPRAAEFLPM
ncbi:lipoprotein [Salmonella enterica subsp. enterica serovar Typhimurium]|nr:lipoprotein [Salmonella enterica subsp. enterica serovar Typhimurium]